ncbi:14211_t:CDS:2 [Racocetra fulgida]|uniref:14211_t:CDS:1 n=1 Tax=Racocetra fulgida TaxID=60492 RepID=A0A9N8WPN8_9GLOM|nr:14211_t:CDS:2 [Racocetra fulgida]
MYNNTGLDAYVKLTDDNGYTVYNALTAFSSYRVPNITISQKLEIINDLRLNKDVRYKGCYKESPYCNQGYLNGGLSEGQIAGIVGVVDFALISALIVLYVKWKFSSQSSDTNLDNDINGPETNSVNDTNGQDTNSDNDTNGPVINSDNDTNGSDINDANGPDTNSDNDTNGPVINSENDTNCSDINDTNAQDDNDTNCSKTPP